MRKIVKIIFKSIKRTARNALAWFDRSSNRMVERFGLDVAALLAAVVFAIFLVGSILVFVP